MDLKFYNLSRSLSHVANLGVFNMDCDIDSPIQLDLQRLKQSFYVLGSYREDLYLHEILSEEFILRAFSLSVEILNKYIDLVRAEEHYKSGIYDDNKFNKSKKQATELLKKIREYIYSDDDTNFKKYQSGNLNTSTDEVKEEEA